jgi:hypothetical protein
MKTILKIIAILLVAVIVAGSIFAVVSNTSLGTSLPGGEDGRPPAALTDASGQTIQPPARPEGDFDREGGASLGGLLGMFGTLAKLGAIVTLILLAEKGIDLLRKRTPRVTTA